MTGQVNAVLGLLFSGFRKLMYRHLVQLLCKASAYRGKCKYKKEQTKITHIRTKNGIQIHKPSVRAVEVSTLLGSCGHFGRFKAFVYE